MHSENPERYAAVSLLHPSVVDFLELTYQFDEDDFHFFHYPTDLRGVGDLSMSFQRRSERF
jgi:hypothetical protein